jgi:hypothetical protein
MNAMNMLVAAAPMAYLTELDLQELTSFTGTRTGLSRHL